MTCLPCTQTESLCNHLPAVLLRDLPAKIISSQFSLNVVCLFVCLFALLLFFILHWLNPPTCTRIADGSGLSRLESSLLFTPRRIGPWGFPPLSSGSGQHLYFCLSCCEICSELWQTVGCGRQAVSQCALCFQEARGWNVGAAPKATGNTNYRSVTIRALNVMLGKLNIGSTRQMLKVFYSVYLLFTLLLRSALLDQGFPVLSLLFIDRVRPFFTLRVGCFLEPRAGEVTFLQAWVTQLFPAAF